MSEKKNKQIKYPSYDINGQLQFLANLCEDMEFDVKKLIPLIFADWICTFQKGCQKLSTDKPAFREVFIAYLKSTQKTYDDLMEIKKVVESSEKKD